MTNNINIDEMNGLNQKLEDNQNISVKSSSNNARINIGKYGGLRQKFLNVDMFTVLQMSTVQCPPYEDELDMLKKLNDQCLDRISVIEKGYLKDKPNTSNFIQNLNNRQNARLIAEEIVLREIVYKEAYEEHYIPLDCGYDADDLI